MNGDERQGKLHISGDNLGADHVVGRACSGAIG